MRARANTVATGLEVRTQVSGRWLEVLDPLGQELLDRKLSAHGKPTSFTGKGFYDEGVNW